MNDDTISRRAAVDEVAKGLKGVFVEYHDVAEKLLNNVPSVQQQKIRGKWIEREDYYGDTYYDCSVCGESWTTIEGTSWDNGMNFCPNCGSYNGGEE